MIPLTLVHHVPGNRNHRLAQPGEVLVSREAVNFVAVDPGFVPGVPDQAARTLVSLRSGDQLVVAEEPEVVRSRFEDDQVFDTTYPDSSSDEPDEEDT